MDRGTDACNLLLWKVIPLQLGYVGVVNRSQEDIMLDRSIKDALVAEENFFRSRPVYNGLADQCGVPQLAEKLNQILVQHINAVLPGLKSRITSELVSLAKEQTSYGEITESKRFPVLRKRMDEVLGKFLREGLEPSEVMIRHIIEMEMDYINTSHPHPNFIGGSKAVETATVLQQIKASRNPPHM